jgi:hypothetical protein
MKKIIFVIFILILSVCFSAFCQISDGFTFAPKKVQIGINVGTSIGFWGKNQSMFSTYFQPTLRYELRPKLYFQSSLLFLNQQFNVNTGNESYIRPYNGNTALIMAGLAYDVNEKLQVSGMIYSNLNQQSINSFNNKNWGAIFNATYKVTENFHISGSVNISNGRNTIFGSPWGNSFQMNQFGRFNNRNW